MKMKNRAEHIFAFTFAILLFGQPAAFGTATVTPVGAAAFDLVDTQVVSGLSADANFDFLDTLPPDEFVGRTAHAPS